MLAFAAISFPASFPALAAPPYPNTSNFGVPFSEAENWYKQCMRVAKLNVPVPGTSRGASPTKCDAGELYYTKRNQAVTSPAEWDKVRACAVANADNGVLMMLYANGYGVPRDTDMAIHYACSLEYVAKAEMEARVEHLAAAPRPGVPFDQCDDITSGYMGAICAEIRERQDERVRTARLTRLTSGLPPVGRSAFARLRAAAERYAAGATGEVDMQGTAAPAFSLKHQGRLREQFMQAALDTASGKLPPSSPAEYAQRDTELNDLYKAVMSAPSKQEDWPDRIGESTITHSAVRDTERLWLAYRDAFAAFAASMPSGPDPTAVKTLLTSQRIAQLRDVARYR
jgi:uncharacterized protein YecT (DUF1311 family)